MKRRKVLLSCAPLLLGAAPPRAAAQTLNGFDLRDALIPVKAIEQGGPPRDGIPSIDKPRFVDAAKSGLKDNDRVLALARNGVARAYPVRILNWHEIVNDQLGGEAIAVTYCPLCGTGMAFDARVAGKAASSTAGPSQGASAPSGGSAGLQRLSVGASISFGVSGLLYNSDVLLYDRGTESLWSQLLEQAVSGPMKGTKLTPVPLTHTSWADWRTRHPRTEVLSTDTGHVRDYERDPYAGYESVPRLMFDVQHREDRLPVKEWVLGLRIAGQAKAYPFSVLDKRVDAKGRLPDRVGGVPVEIRFDRKHRSAEAFDAAGIPLPSVMAFWFAWFAFHPKTEVLAAR